MKRLVYVVLFILSSTGNFIMKTLYHPLLISSVLILGIPLTPALADNASNPWSPSYRPQTDTHPTYQHAPAPRYAPNGTGQAYQPQHTSRQPGNYQHYRQAQPPVATARQYNPAQRPALRQPYYPAPPTGYYRGPQNRPYQRPLPPPRWQHYNGPSAGYDNRNPAYQSYNNPYFNHNNFWQRGGPNSWTHPNKRNFRNGWDDMLNAPSRMGEMPGGWTAPSISMPNPVDVGDQFQQNARNLPDQMRTMNGN